MGYKIHTIKGVSWVGTLNAFTKGISLVRTSILARILSPSQFGVFGIATFVLAFIEMITETGINIFLVQEEKGTEKYLNTAWTVSILRGILISVLIIVTAPLISSFFNSPQSYSLLIFLSLVPFVRGFINPSEVNFQKNLQFGKEFYFRLSLFSVDSIISIILAFATRNVSSLVWGLFISGILEVILSFWLLRPIPKLNFNLDFFRLVLSRGKWVTAAGIFNYLFHNLDNMVVGKMLNVSSLGIYQNAYRFGVLPFNTIADVIAKVTFPVYVKISGDKERLKKAFLKTLFMISLVIIPIGLIFYIYAREAILIFLGPNWLEAIPVFRVLVILGIINSIFGYTSSLFYAVKKQSYVMVATFVSLFGMIVTIIPFTANFGIVGAGISGLIGAIFAVPFFAYYIYKILR